MENMQHTGAYKERGALNKLKCLTKEETSRGVYTASAGNHAQAVAFHAGNLGIKSTIFMPVGTPVIKVTRTKLYGGNVELIGNNFDDAFQACQEHVASVKGTMVHPFDDKYVIAGQGTIGLEILNQAADVDMIVVPVGGGGLISGIALAAKEINPNIRIVGVEPSKIPSMSLVLHGDENIPPAVTTIADGVNVRRVGLLTREICREFVDEWIAVTEEEICRAILFLLEGEKTVAEGAGAAGVAALLAGKINGSGKKIVTVLTGGNIDVNAIAQVIDSGLIDSGRRIKFSMNLPDRAGALTLLMNRISAMKANVVNVHLERRSSFGAGRVHMILDVAGKSHADEILEDLRARPLYADMDQEECRVTMDA